MDIYHYKITIANYCIIISSTIPCVYISTTLYNHTPSTRRYNWSNTVSLTRAVISSLNSSSWGSHITDLQLHRESIYYWDRSMLTSNCIYNEYTINLQPMVDKDDVLFIYRNSTGNLRSREPPPRPHILRSRTNILIPVS